MKFNSKEQNFQALKLIEIGIALKQKREEMFISRYQIHKSTKILMRHLQAIEEGNLSALPEPIYIQGFIRKYGQEVGMAAIADQFPLTICSTPKSWLRATELRPLHLYLIYITLVASAVSLLSREFSSSVPYTISEQETLLSAAARLEPTAPTKQKNPIANAQISSPILPPAKAVSIQVTMKGESWMRVEVDGAVKFEGILSDGTSRAWQGNQDILLRAGNAGAVQIKFNQQSPQLLGQAGQVVQKTFKSPKVQG